MDSAPYLQAEDKLDYERLVEELLHNEQVRAALRRTPDGPNAEQLHTLAMRDFATVSAEAASEYTYFVELRAQARSTTPAPDWERLGGDDPAQWQEPDNPLVAAERAGWVPLIAVLLPILSGLSAAVLLILGYSFRADGMSLGQQLVTAGLVAAVVCAASIAADIIGLLLTAARDAATPPEGRSPELYAELAKARETWHTALRDRALLPYLLSHLGATPRPLGPRPAGVSLVRQRPRLGYTSPGFTSPGAERISNQRGEDTEPSEEGEPHFTSPGFTSPGPERITKQRGEEQKPGKANEPHFTSPGFSSPDYDSPGPIEAVPEESRNGSGSTAAIPAQTPAPTRTPARRSRFLPNADDGDAG